MRDTVAKLPESGEPLGVRKVQPAEDTSAVPWHTVLIHGRHDGSDEPLAGGLMTVPSRAADDSAILWRTPKPSMSAARLTQSAFDRFHLANVEG